MLNFSIPKRRLCLESFCVSLIARLPCRYLRVDEGRNVGPGRQQSLLEPITHLSLVPLYRLQQEGKALNTPKVPTYCSSGRVKRFLPAAAFRYLVVRPNLSVDLLSISTWMTYSPSFSPSLPTRLLKAPCPTPATMKVSKRRYRRYESYRKRTCFSPHQVVKAP